MKWVPNNRNIKMKTYPKSTNTRRKSVFFYTVKLASKADSAPVIVSEENDYCVVCAMCCEHCECMRVCVRVQVQWMDGMHACKRLLLVNVKRFFSLAPFLFSRSEHWKSGRVNDTPTKCFIVEWVVSIVAAKWRKTEFISSLNVHVMLNVTEPSEKENGFQ